MADCSTEEPFPAVADDGSAAGAVVRSKHEHADEEKAEHAVFAAGVGMTSLPYDLMGEIVQWLSSEMAMRLACTERRLCRAVYASLRKLECDRCPEGSAELLARMTALQTMRLSWGMSDEALSVILPQLPLLPRLQTLDLGKCSASLVDAVCEAIVQMPELSRIYVPDSLACAELGEAMAACRKLVDVRFCGRPSDLPACLLALAAQANLHTLAVQCYSTEVLEAFQVACTSWPQLTKLHISIGTGAPDPRVISSALATVQASCAGLRCLRLTSFSSFALLTEALDSMFAMRALEELILRGIKLDASCIDVLTRMRQLQALRSFELDCRAAEAAWLALARSLADLPCLSNLFVGAYLVHTPPSVVVELARAIREHGSRQRVTLHMHVRRSKCDDEPTREEAMTALADAFLLSSVTNWILRLTDDAAAHFVRRCAEGGKPRAAVRLLNLSSLSGGEDTVRALLAAIRACPSLQRVQCKVAGGGAELLKAELKAAPLDYTRCLVSRALY